jgi:hypothetical protein
MSKLVFAAALAIAVADKPVSLDRWSRVRRSSYNPSTTALLQALPWLPMHTHTEMMYTAELNSLGTKPIWYDFIGKRFRADSLTNIGSCPDFLATMTDRVHARLDCALQALRSINHRIGWEMTCTFMTSH